MPGSIIQSHPINTREGYDMISETQKVTAGYFTDGGTLLAPADIYTGSVADANENYYFDITQAHPGSSSAETQFSVAYGHVDGSGSDAQAASANDIYAPTEAIYKQWANVLLAENEVTGGFKISSQEGDNPSSRSGSARDEFIYILIGKRTRFKDRINRKNWTISLSGSDSRGSGSLGTGAIPFEGTVLKLTDDSSTTKATSTVAGPRYNIVSGSNGTVAQAASVKNYGWFYPDQGVMVFSGTELSASIPGMSGSGTAATAPNKVAEFHESSTPHVNNGQYISSSGFAPNTTNTANAKNALRFINCLKHSSTVNADSVLNFRSEEDQNATSYFCRVKGAQANFSTSPTFISGAFNELRHNTMWGNPTTFITGVQLYDGAGNIVAVGALSTPLKKNFFSEATIKVKLTY